MMEIFCLLLQKKMMGSCLDVPKNVKWGKINVIAICGDGVLFGKIVQIG